jgi:hypothetical protein
LVFSAATQPAQFLVLSRRPLALLLGAVEQLMAGARLTCMVRPARGA